MTAVLDRPGTPVQALPLREVFDDQRLDALPQSVGGTYLTADGNLENLPGGQLGVSIQDLVSGAGVDLASVRSLDVSPGTAGQPGGSLAASAGDFELSGTPAFPFTYDAFPLLTSFSDATLYVGQRTTPASGLANGVYFTATDGQELDIVLHLSTTLAHPSITTASSTVDVNVPVTFAGAVEDIDDSEGATWAWDFRDGGTGGPAATVTHTFTAAGTYVVTATATAANGSQSGAASKEIIVNGPSTPPTSTTPPPPTGPDLGTGSSRAPNVGPREGSGPRVGGAVTGSGSGRPGPTRDPRSAPGAITGSGTAAAPNGSVVGYLLSDGDLVAQAPRAAVTPRNDSAPAARAGVEATSLPGWLLGAGAVVVLVALGALSERRRPTTTPRTRPRRKR